MRTKGPRCLNALFSALPVTAAFVSIIFLLSNIWPQGGLRPCFCAVSLSRPLNGCSSPKPLKERKPYVPQCVKISASSAARDRKRSMTIPKTSLHKSDIEQQHRPILCQPPTGLDLRQGQGSQLRFRQPIDCRRRL